MRITGGKYLRRNIICPPGVIRPAMDRMRESLFAILGDLSGSSFLDLFSGSGCVAIEAASRGANPIHLVELDKGKEKTILKNLSFVEEDKKLFIKDVYTFIETYKGASYSIVYADPPFAMDEKIELLKKIDEKNLVKENGLFIIHYPLQEENEWPNSIGTFFIVDTRKYGKNMIRIYKRGKNALHN